MLNQPYLTYLDKFVSWHAFCVSSRYGFSSDRTTIRLPYILRSINRVDQRFMIAGNVRSVRCGRVTLIFLPWDVAHGRQIGSEIDYAFLMLPCKIRNQIEQAMTPGYLSSGRRDGGSNNSCLSEIDANDGSQSANFQSFLYYASW